MSASEKEELSESKDLSFSNRRDEEYHLNRKEKGEVRALDVNHLFIFNSTVTDRVEAGLFSFRTREVWTISLPEIITL